jgi:Rod binding domain-containing protein
MDAVALQGAVAGVDPKPLPKDLEGACRALEATFAGLVFRKMQEAMVPKSSRGSAGFARETTEAMLTTQWAELASQGEGLGLWRALYRQLEPQAVKSGPAPADESAGKASVPGEAERQGRDAKRVLTKGLGTGHPLAAVAARPAVPGLLGSKEKEAFESRPAEKRTTDTP